MVEKHFDAIAYDCIALGLRLRDLGSDSFTWGDLRAVITQAPRISALYRSMHPDEAEWGLQELLSATTVDLLKVHLWQQGGGKQSDYPKPIPRPGVEPDEKKFGKEAIPYDEMKDWLGWQ